MTRKENEIPQEAELEGQETTEIAEELEMVEESEAAPQKAEKSNEAEQEKQEETYEQKVDKLIKMIRKPGAEQDPKRKPLPPLVSIPGRLFIIAFVTALLLGLVIAVTRAPIRENAEAAAVQAQEAEQAVVDKLPGGEGGAL